MTRVASKLATCLYNARNQIDATTHIIRLILHAPASRLSPGRHGSNSGPTGIDRSFLTSRGILCRQTLHVRATRGPDAIHIYLCPPPSSTDAITPTMHEVSRLLQAAAALSQLLRDSGVPHAFHGNVLTALLCKAPLADEICCIVEGGAVHPFRRVRQACAGNEEFAVVSSPWSNRLHVKYQRLIPTIDIEILPAGEEGPRRLDSSTIMVVGRVPFLTITEFIRAKIKAWSIRALERDAQDITYAMSRYWNRVDVNRIPEQEMNDFATHFPAAAPSWKDLKRKYGMS